MVDKYLDQLELLRSYMDYWLKFEQKENQFQEQNKGCKIDNAGFQASESVARIMGVNPMIYDENGDLVESGVSRSRIKPYSFENIKITHEKLCAQMPLRDATLLTKRTLNKFVENY